MQQCPTCGSLNPDNADVCADCGMELPSHGATPAATPQVPAATVETPVATPQTPAATVETPAATPQTPASTPFDFASESSATPDASSLTPTPVEAAGNDPFAGSGWDFPVDKGTDVPTSVEAPPVDFGTPPASTLESAPTQVVEPSTVPSTSSGAASGTAKLILKRGGAATGDVFTIGSSATIGRFDPESGPVDVDMANLPEAVYISRHHAEINLRDGQWMVKDLGSRNGTFVKNASGFARVTGETAVVSGDEVAFGNARFEFQIA